MKNGTLNVPSDNCGKVCKLYLDDTFLIFNNEQEATLFFNFLNGNKTNINFALTARWLSWMLTLIEKVIGLQHRCIERKHLQDKA